MLQIRQDSYMEIFGDGWKNFLYMQDALAHAEQ